MRIPKHPKALQGDECWHCGKRVGGNALRLVIDRHTDEVLAPADPDPAERGTPALLGSRCARRFPGVAAYARN